MFHRFFRRLGASVSLELSKIPEGLLRNNDGRRSPDQQRRYDLLRGKSLQAAFPALAASWVGPCWGSVMITPEHVPALSTKLAIWHCQFCHKEFEKTIATFVNINGLCPWCGQCQGDALKLAGADDNPVARIIPAERVSHKNYRSVLHANPEWKRNIQPMLAQQWSDIREHIQSGEILLVSPKLDGIRCLIGFNERTLLPQCFTRSGALLDCCEGLFPHLMPLFKDDPSLILDGELFGPQCSFENLNGLVRSTRPSMEVKKKQDELLEYFAFDIMYAKTLPENAPFRDRYSRLKALIPRCGAQRITTYEHDDRNKKVHRASLNVSPDATRKLFHVPAATIQLDEIDEVLQEACSQGFEGIMIRRPMFPYEFGKRSGGLAKYKMMHDSEYEIIGFTEGQGKLTNSLGSFVCKTREGLRFHATPKADLAMRKSLWTGRHKFLGKMLTVQYQELSGSDVPRFPIGKCVRGSLDGSDWL